MAELVPPEQDEPIVIVVGGISHGKVFFKYSGMNFNKTFKINVDYTEGEIKISNYPLSAGKKFLLFFYELNIALCCAKLTSSFEQLWGVI